MVNNDSLISISFKKSDWEYIKHVLVLYWATDLKEKDKISEYVQKIESEIKNG